jgi:diguanylate cyclase (GGDEF)-like protein
MRVALVDQSRTIVRIVTELVQADGHEVLGFTDARSAFAALAADADIRALITSIQLQSLTGIELCAAAREMVGTRRPLYIILMSSSDDKDIAIQAIQALDCGADDFMRKPPDKEELRARLRLADRVTSMQAELICYATTDSLSGLLNRREFFHRAAEAARQAEEGLPLSAILLDLDEFKRVNDSYGHSAGDRAIAVVGSQLNRFGGIIGRLGGEEFCLLVQRDRAHAFDVAEELRAALAETQLTATGKEFTLSGSFGVAQWQQGDTIDRLLRRADQALYRAKDQGRNCVVCEADHVGAEPSPSWRSRVRTQVRASHPG